MCPINKKKMGPDSMHRLYPLLSPPYCDRPPLSPLVLILTTSLIALTLILLSLSLLSLLFEVCSSNEHWCHPLLSLLLQTLDEAFGLVDCLPLCRIDDATSSQLSVLARMTFPAFENFSLLQWIFSKDLCPCSGRVCCSLYFGVSGEFRRRRIPVRDLLASVMSRLK